MTSKAQRIINAIKRNVDEMYADVVTFERFSTRNGRLWNRARIAGVEDEVLRNWRERNPA